MSCNYEFNVNKKLNKNSKKSLINNLLSVKFQDTIIESRFRMIFDSILIIQMISLILLTNGYKAERLRIPSKLDAIEINDYKYSIDIHKKLKLETDLSKPRVNENDESDFKVSFY